MPNIFMRRLPSPLLTVAVVLLSIASSAAQELLPDPSFEDLEVLGDRSQNTAASTWHEVYFYNPIPDVNASVDPLSGSEHGIIQINTSQHPPSWGPTIESFARAGEGGAVDITDFRGLTLTLSSNYKVVAENMTPAEDGAFVIMWLSYYSETSVLGSGYSDVLSLSPFEGTSDSYQNFTYEITVPDFILEPVTVVGFNLATVPGEGSTGNATVYFDDVSLTLPSVGNFGDYNGNGVVDAADYTVWRDGMTAASTTLLNDPTPGTVDESDFLYWRDNFGNSFAGASSASAATVPEPATVTLASVLFMFLALASRSSKR